MSYRFTRIGAVSRGTARGFGVEARIVGLAVAMGEARDISNSIADRLAPHRAVFPWADRQATGRQEEWEQ